MTAKTPDYFTQFRSLNLSRDADGV
ncbi:MAG: hypothetical protein RLY86_1898, partial [Pseudomonadota bacterium]